MSQHREVQSKASHRIYNRFRSLAEAIPGEKPILKLPKLPVPTFTGMRTFIHQNNRSEMGSVQLDTWHSEHNCVELNYHNTMKGNQAAI
jgi:hypothetical protein